ncbi:hypothetical protein [Floridanema evergladense]|uniref:Uncharacterized protein n=1 Tax=Floridaenema evergladense BLCC-F167 TaxID=3153639 RepID=A0ABV4WFM8_9CYAN
MSDLETLLNELATLIDESKLTIGNSSIIKREISLLNDIQIKLLVIYNDLNSDYEFEKNKNMAMGMLKFVAPIASFFIPGGFLIDQLVSGALKAVAYKFGETDTQLTLEDLLEKIPYFVGWSETLREIAKDLLNNYDFFTVLDLEIKHPILTEQFRQINETLNIHLEFGDESILKQQLQQIKTAQKDLKQIQLKIDKILQDYEDSEDIVERIKVLLMFFGDTVFAIDWIDDEEALIISFGEQGVPKVSEVTVIEECFSIKEKANSLVLQANNLRGQAEQSIRYLEEERRRLEAEEKRRIEEERRRLEAEEKRHQQEKEHRHQAEEQRQRETTPIRIKNEQLKPPVKRSRFPIKALLAASTVAALGYAGWTSGIATPQIQQLLNNLHLSQNTDEQKPNSLPQTSANLETAQKPKPEQQTSVNLAVVQTPNPELQTSTNLETSQKPNSEQQPSVNLEVAQTPNHEAQTSANLQTSQKPISEQETSVNLEAIQKPNPEQQAAANLETAQKLAMEAAVMTQNSPHPLEIWQKSQAKWQEAVNLLEAIPENSPISVKAKEKLAVYRTNYTAITNRLIAEEKASTNLETAKKLAMEAAVLAQNPPHPAEVWQQAKAKWQEAISLLEAIPNNTFVSVQAKEKLTVYRTNYAAVSQR